MTNIVRRRARVALTSAGAWGLVALFLGGLLAFGIGSDYLESQRSLESQAPAQFAVAEKCATAMQEIQRTSLDPRELLPAVCHVRP